MNAETVAGNSDASRKPDQYMQSLAARIQANEDLLAGVVDFWLKTQEESTLAGPLWPLSFYRPIATVTKEAA